MARKSTPAVQAKNNTDDEAIQGAANAHALVVANTAQVAEKMGYYPPYDCERIVQEARFYLAQSAEAMLEVGKRLLILREREGHGGFTKIVEERIGIPARTAQKMMQAAYKYLDNSALESKKQAFERLGKSKMFELMTLDDDDLEELADGGSVANLTLDDIDRMSARELKAALRDARAGKAATEHVLATRNKKIDKLESELNRKKENTPEEEWEWGPARKALLDTCESIAASISTTLRRELVDIQNQGDEKGGLPESIDALQEQALTSLAMALVEIQKDFKICINLDNILITPEGGVN